MRRAAGHPELLDGPLDAELLAGNLRDLRRVNRWLGGSRLSRDALAPFVVGREGSELVRLLDVGTGAADIPLSLLHATSRGRHARLSISATDIRPEIVWVAREAVAEQPIEVREARLEDEATESYDVVHMSLVLHHLDPTPATTLLQDARRVARQAVIVNDLDRGWRWFAGAWLLTRLLTRNPYTRNDAPLSVRRAYTATEVVDMGRQIGLRPVALYRTRPAYRYALVFVPEDAAHVDG